MTATTSKNPATRTASTCTVQKARGTHTFTIADYSLLKGLGAGKFIRSTEFDVGGYRWCIRFYPDGDGTGTYKDYVQAYLELMTKRAEVRAHFDFRLVDHATGQSRPMHRVATPTVVFNTADARSGTNSAFGTYTSTTKKEIEASSYLWNDCLIIECNVTVIAKQLVVKETSPPPEQPTGVVQVPPPSSDLSKSLRKLLEEKRGTDVTVKVKGDVFFAHKTILAMRSPVFSNEFFKTPTMAAENDSSGTGRYVVDVEDVDPDVFGALLHFIYTDSTPPSMEDVDDPESMKMVKHLLVAADKYAVERLKLVCENILRKNLDVENVAATLALAEQCQFSSLRDACVAFIANTNRIEKVVASQGYMNLRKGSPPVVVGMLENVIAKLVHSSKK